MSNGGLSKARLGRMHDVMARHVERGDVPGVVTLVSRRGETHVDAIGTMTIDGSDPIRRDTIFRITSMTKPVTAVAAMVLVEECALQLDEPVDRLLPELADRRVLKRLDGPLDDTEPAKRPITVRDLLDFGMGLGLMFGPPDAYPILQALDEQQIMIGPPKPPTPHAPDEWIRRLGRLPLMHQPGERWMYNTGAHVLSVLTARASGQPFETFLQERIFEPLGMEDTAFSVPADKLDRFPPCYEEDPQSGGLRVHDGVQDSQWARAPIFPDGAAGLVSTVDDYLAFGQMMLSKGRHGRERILSRPSVEVMTTDQLTPERRAASDLFLLGDSYGWGFGVAVCRRRDDISAVPGRFGWDGGYGTSWYSDPTEEVVGILMTPRLAAPQYSSLRLDFWTSVYQAIDD
ncbi:MAG TPA: serine hydrolase domain-containing protein [Acidimicrobiia bacterium]